MQKFFKIGKGEKIRFENVLLTYDYHGKYKYSCSICGYTPSRLEIRTKGWGKYQQLVKIILDHVKEKHGK